MHRTRSGRAVTRRRGQPGHPERGAHSIVTDLAAAGYAVTQKRRPPQPLPDPGAPPATRTRQPGTRHRRRPGPPSRRRRETAADRYGTSLRAPVAGQLHARPAHQAGWALSALRGSPARRRSAAAVPTGVGTMVAPGHPQGDSRQLPRPSRETRPRRSRHDPPRARHLPSRAPGPPAREPSTADLHALATCLSCLR